jgi:hypothetical protein
MVIQLLFTYSAFQLFNYSFIQLLIYEKGVCYLQVIGVGENHVKD